MKKTALGFLSFILLQAGWFSCVLGAARGWPWLGPAVVTLLISLHVATSSEQRRELGIVLVAGVVGTLIDSIQAFFGLLNFAEAPIAGMAPLWITALWMHFGTAFTGPLAALRGSPKVTSLLGVIGAPITYWAGQRLGAVAFHADIWPSIVSIAVAWGIYLPAALAWASRLTSIDEPGAPWSPVVAEVKR